MKVRLFVGLSALALVVAALAFSAKTFRVTAQDKTVVGVDKTPPPPFNPIRALPPPSAIMPSPAPTTVSFPSGGVVQATAQAQVPEPSLPELIANLKELRKQEQQLTKAIKEKIKAQKRSIDDAESELKSLSIDFANGGPTPDIDPNDKGPAKPRIEPPPIIPTKGK